MVGRGIINKISNFLGINKGSAIYLHLLKELGQFDSDNRKVAFFHRNSSDVRKDEILRDLQLPLISKEKKLICVVSTVSLGILPNTFIICWE